MKQPKYSPQEALERVKLMMKYDTSKTLTENKQIISEQPTPFEITATGLGAIGGAGVAAGGASALGAVTAGAIAGTAAFPVVGTAIGALVGLGLGALTQWGVYKDNGKEGFSKLMEACKAPGASKLVKKMSKGDIRNVVNSIEDSKGDWNDDEDAIVSALQKIETIADLCEVDKKITGGLVEFLDGITDSPKEWKMFARPIQGMIEDTEIVLTPEEQKKVKDKVVTASGESSKYKPCSGTYSLYCKSPKIGQVQGCLGGLKMDNAFGPLTLAKLKEKGFGESFTDADIDKICSKQEPNKPEISGEIGSISVEEL